MNDPLEHRKPAKPKSRQERERRKRLEEERRSEEKLARALGAAIPTAPVAPQRFVESFLSAEKETKPGSPVEVQGTTADGLTIEDEVLEETFAPIVILGLEYYTLPQIAKIMSVPIAAVYKLTSRGELPVKPHPFDKRIRLVEKRAFDEYLKKWQRLA